MRNEFLGNSSKMMSLVCCVEYSPGLSIRLTLNLKSMKLNVYMNVGFWIGSVPTLMTTPSMNYHGLMRYKYASILPTGTTGFSPLKANMYITENSR